jgi:preprotein translocase subunit SecA
LIDREKEDLRPLLVDESRAFYEQREAELTTAIMRELERVVLLRTVDRHWMYFIDVMHQLRHEIHLQAYGQRDPLVQYRLQSAEMFEDMIRQIQADVVRAIYHIQVNTAPRRQSVAGEATGYQPRIAAVGGGSAQAQSGGEKQGKPAGAGRKKAVKQEPVTVDKVGRNEPCPCGSGKKYKKCCGASQ